MTVQELFRSVRFEDVWPILAKEYPLDEIGYLHDEEQLFEAADEARQRAHQHAFDELIAMPQPVPLEKPGFVVVVRLEDTTHFGSFTYEVFIAYPGNRERYGVEFLPWAECLAHTVWEKSLQTYGAGTFAVHLLHAMTFLGFSREAAEMRQDEIHDELIASMDEDKTEGCITLDEFQEEVNAYLKSVGCDPLLDESEEVEVARRAQTEKIIRRNQTILDEMMGYEVVYSQ